MTTSSYFYLAHESPNVIIKCSDTYALFKSPCWAEMRSGSLYNEPWQTLNLKWPLRGLISSTEGFSEQFSGNGLDYEFPTQGHKDVCSKGCHKANGLKQKSEGGFPVAQSWTEMQGLCLGTASSMCFYLFVSFCFCQKKLGSKILLSKKVALRTVWKSSSSFILQNILLLWFFLHLLSLFSFSSFLHLEAERDECCCSACSFYTQFRILSMGECCLHSELVLPPQLDFSKNLQTYPEVYFLVASKIQ